MPRQLSTRGGSQRPKPKMPEGIIGGDLTPEEKRTKLNVFLQDFDIEVKKRLDRIQHDQTKIITTIEKEVHLQISYLPKEIREMNIMDFIAAGGTVESAMAAHENDSFAEKEFPKTVRKKKEKGGRKGKASKTEMAPPASAAPAATAKKSRATRARFQTPSTTARQMPAVWDTPAVTPKFDTNLPFTPGFARAPKQGEKLMSLTGSPVDISTTYKVNRTLKHTRIAEEDEETDLEVVSLISSKYPGVAKTDIHKILKDLSAAVPK